MCSVVQRKKWAVSGGRTSGMDLSLGRDCAFVWGPLTEVEVEVEQQRSLGLGFSTSLWKVQRDDNADGWARTRRCPAGAMAQTSGYMNGDMSKRRHGRRCASDDYKRASTQGQSEPHWGIRHREGGVQTDPDGSGTWMLNGQVRSQRAFHVNRTSSQEETRNVLHDARKLALSAGLGKV